jgi:hypothetical protein
MIKTQKDFHFPLSKGSLGKLVGALFERTAEFGVVATTTAPLLRDGVRVVTQPGDITDIYVVSPLTPGVGERVDIEILASTDGGATFTSIFSSAFTLNATTHQAGKQVSMISKLATASKAVAVGTIFVVSLTYTAGTATPLANLVVGMEIGDIAAS